MGWLGYVFFRDMQRYNSLKALREKIIDGLNFQEKAHDIIARLNEEFRKNGERTYDLSGLENPPENMLNHFGIKYNEKKQCYK